MIRRRRSLFTAAGSFALALGLSLRLWTHSNNSHFATSFLLGVAIALLILGLKRQSRGISS